MYHTAVGVCVSNSKNYPYSIPHSSSHTDSVEVSKGLAGAAILKIDTTKQRAITGRWHGCHFKNKGMRKLKRGTQASLT